MGITAKDIELLDNIISQYKPQTVIELGAQNLYNQPALPAPYAHEYYEAKGLTYSCIDLSKENNCIEIDLSKPLGAIVRKSAAIGATGQKTDNGKIVLFDLVTDFGTSEHVGNNGKHDIEAYYNCWKTKYDLCKPGGIIISVNPKTGNWPGHGFQYLTEDFYHALLSLLNSNDYSVEEHPAMGNTENGWNIICYFQKPDAPFITFEQFKTLPVYEK